MDDVRAKSRSVSKTVKVTEDRCVCCGAWVERTSPAAPRVTCGNTCKKRLYRMRQRGEKPPFAV